MLSRQTAIRCCYLAGFLDLFAVGMFFPLFNRRGRQLGASPSALGLIGSVYGGLQFFSSPYMGKVCDSWGRKPVLLLSYLGCFIGYLTMGVTDTILLFALSRLPTGILKHSQTSAKAHLSDITLPEEKAGVIGMFNAVGSIGFIIGPIIGGAVAMQENGFYKVSLLTCTVYVCAFIFVWLVLDNNVMKKLKDSAVKQSIRQHEVVDKNNTGMRDHLPGTLNDDLKRRRHVVNTMENPDEETGKKEPAGISRFFSYLKIDSVQNVLDIMLIRFVMSFSMMVYRSNFTAMLDYRYGVDAKTTGYIISFGSIVGAITGMSIGRIYKIFKSDATMMFFGSLLMTTALFGISVSPNIYALLISMIPLALSSAMMRVNSHNLMLKHCRADEKGAVMGVGNSLVSFARMLSPAIAGFAEEMSVVGPCLLALCFAGVGTALIFVLAKDKSSTEEAKKSD